MSWDVFNGMPGITDLIQTSEKELAWASWSRGMLQFGIVVLDSAAADAGNTPTTTLRKGLALGIVTSSNKAKPHSATATTGEEVARYILAEDVNMLDYKLGTAADKRALVLLSGPVNAASIVSLTALIRQQLSTRFMFSDDLLANWSSYPKIVAKTGNYTVLTSDNNTLFTTRGNSGALTFTLPAVQRGLEYDFLNEVDQNMAITAPANTLVGFNNATATTATFSTAGQKIGAGAKVVSNDNGTKWLLLNRGTQTVTMS